MKNGRQITKLIGKLVKYNKLYLEKQTYAAT